MERGEERRRVQRRNGYSGPGLPAQHAGIAAHVTPLNPALRTPAMKPWISPLSAAGQRPPVLLPCGAAVAAPGARQADARIIRTALAPIICDAAFVLPVTIVGITELSHTRSPWTPWTRRVGSTTASASVPILHVPTGWK